MLPQNTFLAALVVAIANASPYPLAATTSVPSTTGSPFFGNKNGNFQPSRASPTDGARVDAVDATGGKISNGGLAVTTINDNDGVGAGSDSYTQYNGDGTTGDGWPAKSRWVSFTDMFNNNKPVMSSSCGQYGQADDSATEIGAIHDAIEAIAKQTLVDHRFILAVVMQESGGCVRAPTTKIGVRNPGLMQDHNGAGTCNDGGVKNPCPNSEVTQMIQDGTAGTNDGDGLAQCINESKAGDVSAFYKAARIYNSGSVDSSGNLGAGIATHCYASDIANRLTGWVKAAHACTLD